MSPTTSPNAAIELPSTRSVRTQALLQFALIPPLHLLIMLGACRLMGWSIVDYANASDGASYLWKAAKYLGQPLAAATATDERVFPGYPMLMAAIGLSGLSLHWAGLLIAWFSSAALSAVGTLWLKRPLFGWLLLIFPGGFLVRKSMVATEPLFLFLCVLACALSLSWRRFALAGAVIAMAGLVRPNAIFPAVGLAVVLLSRCEWKSLTRYVAGGGAATAALLVLAWRLGEGLLESTHGYQRHYGGSIFTWPGAAIWESLYWRSFQNSNFLFTMLFYLITLLCFVYFACTAWRRRGDDLLHLVWIGGNTAFALCVGTYAGWVFAPRFLAWAAPSMLVAAMAGLNSPRQWVWDATALGLGITIGFDLMITIAAREVR